MRRATRLAPLVLIAITALFVFAAPFSSREATAESAGSAQEKQPTPTPEPATPEGSFPESPKAVSLRIVLTGDINLNRNRVEVLPEGSNVWGTIVPFDRFADGIQGQINGDINFGNVETVITDRNDLKEQDKAFCFRTHPNGIRMLLKNGFNLFSLANNHAYDYGADGVRETIRHLTDLQKESEFHWSGIGYDKNRAIEPAVFEIKGVKVAFAALGIGHAAGPSSPGVAQEIYYREALSRLAAADADLRILSNHDGKEGTSIPIDRQLRVYREAIRDYGVHIVVGHHPHVVQGIERYANGMIFYSLGNFMIRGAADMGSRAGNRPQRDFGLLARIDLEVAKGRGPRFKRLEVLPVVDMHQGPHPFADVEEAHLRLDAVNELSSHQSVNALWTPSLPRSTEQTGMILDKQDGVGVYTFD